MSTPSSSYERKHFVGDHGPHLGTNLAIGVIHEPDGSKIEIPIGWCRSLERLGWIVEVPEPSKATLVYDAADNQFHKYIGGIPAPDDASFEELIQDEIGREYERTGRDDLR